jgi:hypothetical protein
MILGLSDQLPSKKDETIPVTGSGNPQVCETSRLPHFLDNRLKDDGEVISLTRRLPFTSRKLLVLISVRS